MHNNIVMMNVIQLIQKEIKTKIPYSLSLSSRNLYIISRNFHSLQIPKYAINKQNNRIINYKTPHECLMKCNAPLKSFELSFRRYYYHKPFNRPYRFGHQKVKADLGIIDFVWWSLVSGVLLYHVFDIEYIWENYVPTLYTEYLKEKGRNFLAFVRKITHTTPRVEALTLPEENTNNGNGNAIVGSDDVKLKPKKKNNKLGFRDRKIVEYENRIRTYSTPDKIFRYFASIKIVYDDHESEIFMTPDDFLRALTPGIKQPDGLGLDQFKRIDLSKDPNSDLNTILYEAFITGKTDLFNGLKTDSIFYKLSNYGLINYSDFLFLLTVLSVSRRHFEIAFRMFDLNGDGNVEYDEFEKVQNAILYQTSTGKKLGSASGGYKGVSSALAKYFFGEDLKQKLTTEKFLDFQRQLQTEILTLEFERKKPNPVTGRIKETDFAELLIAYAGFPEKKRDRMIKRLKKRYFEGSEESNGITLDDYLKLFNFLQNINDVDIALTVFHIAGASIDQSTLKHVAKMVAHVEFRDHLIEVLFTLFDENQDGQLSNREFIAVMKERLRRGLSKPKDTGFMKLIHALWKSLKIDL